MLEPLELQFINGDVLVFQVEDWAILRKKHRIIGNFIGTYNLLDVLPCKLLCEEALLLLDLKIAKIIKFENDLNIESNTLRFDQLKQFEDDLLKEQQIFWKANRKKQLESMKDQIIEAKRRKGDNRKADEILLEELEKSCQLTENTMIWPIPNTAYFSNEIKTEISREKIFQFTNETKYEVFKDLYNKGYFITHGHKFGADFLVYQGEPIIHHAIFIVRCVEHPNKAISSTEIVAFGRLGTAVRKRAVLASRNEDNSINYVTINWIDA